MYIIIRENNYDIFINKDFATNWYNTCYNNGEKDLEFITLKEGQKFRYKNKVLKYDELYNRIPKLFITVIDALPIRVFKNKENAVLYGEEKTASSNRFKIVTVTESENYQDNNGTYTFEDLLDFI